MVLISSLAAAGVHAAVAPMHLREGALVGSFFVACAGAQLSWAAVAWHRPSPTVLWSGIVGNLAVLALWLVSRTVGIPGVGGGPEPLGPWDLTCALWEVVIVVGCFRMLGEPDPDRTRTRRTRAPVRAVLARAVCARPGHLVRQRSRCVTHA